MKGVIRIAIQVEIDERTEGLRVDAEPVVVAVDTAAALVHAITILGADTALVVTRALVEEGLFGPDKSPAPETPRLILPH